MPDARYASKEILEAWFPGDQECQVVNSEAAVELFVPRGGHALYGLLGATFRRASTDELKVQVATSSYNGPALENSLAHRVDDVRKGLVEEFARAVMDAFRRTDPQVPPLPPGRLLFDRAAQGMVGSCQVIFRELARLVVCVMVTDLSVQPTEQLRELLENLAL